MQASNLSMSLKEKYQKEISKNVASELGIGNDMAIPRLVKIVVNVGVKEAMEDKKVLDAVSSQLEIICGQKPSLRRAKKSIAAFKLREGLPIGLSVTLRSDRMYEFFEKLVTIVFPRVRDFHGVPTESFDGNGNYSLGLKEQIVFPEIDYSQIDKIRGLEVTIVTTAKEDKGAMVLLKALGMPFKK